jgi:hypothetical protein
MKELVECICWDNHNLGNGNLKMDGFTNGPVYPALMDA